MSDDTGEEFILTDEQFETIVNEVLDTMRNLMIKFASSPKETYHQIAKEYKEIYDDYKKILKGYHRRKKLGIEVIPTVRFDHEAGTMAPGYRHKDSVDRFEKWYKILIGKNNGKRGMFL